MAEECEQYHKLDDSSRCPFILKATETELDEYAHEKLIDIFAIVLTEGVGIS